MKLAKDLLELVLNLARDCHPREFLGLLESRRKDVITDLILIPGIQTGERMGILNPDMIPLGMRIVGTVHSHPSGELYPSDQDLEMFSKMGGYHLILGSPYGWDDWRCYDSSGNRLELELI